MRIRPMVGSVSESSFLPLCKSPQTSTSLVGKLTEKFTIEMKKGRESEASTTEKCGLRILIADLARRVKHYQEPYSNRARHLVT